MFLAPASHHLRLIFPELFSSKTLFTCLAFIYVLFPTTAFTQLPSRLERISVEQGLSQGMVTAIYQDSKGFMWFGTRDGLNRYDGHNFKVFRHNPFDSTSISGNYISAIFEDHLGYLWIGTRRSGFSRFDPRSECFQRFQQDADYFNNLRENVIYAFNESLPGKSENGKIIWVAGDSSLIRLVGHLSSDAPKEMSIQEASSKSQDRSSDKFSYAVKHFLNDSLANDNMTTNLVKDVLIDRRGTLWVATAKGLKRADATTLKRDEIPFQSIELPKNSANDGGSVRCDRLVAAKDGAIWVATNAALWRITSTASEENNIQIFPYPEFRSGASPSFETYATNLCLDQSGQVWVTRYDMCGLVFDPVIGTFQCLSEKFSSDLHVLNKLNLSVYSDRSGVVWIGSSGFGLNKYDPKKEQFNSVSKVNIKTTPSPPTSYVANIGEDHSGAITVRMHRNHYKLDVVQNVMELYPGKMPADVRMMMRDRAGLMWLLSGSKGAFFVDSPLATPKKIFPMKNDQNMELEWPTFLEDQPGDTWFISSQVDSVSSIAIETTAVYLCQWDRRKQLVVKYLLPDLPPGLIYRNGVRTPDGVFWFASHEGLVRINVTPVKTYIFRNDPNDTNSLNQNTLKTVQLDPLLPNKYLWIGTEGGGLNRLDLKKEAFSHYLEKDGLPNNVIYGILPDDHGNLWLSTNNGLSKATLDKNTRKVTGFRNYNAHDGLPGIEFNTDAYLKNDRGELFFGGVNGLTWFHPDSIRDNPHPPPVVFTDLQIHYKSVSHKDADSPLQKAITESEELVLSHENNVIAFEFAALDYSSQDKNQFSYKMENFDPKWSTPSSDRRAAYTNIDPGEYIFRVRASNNDGVWNEEGASIKVIILSPWWLTWWAYTLYGIFLFTGLLLLRRYETNRQRHKHKAHLRQIETRKLQEVDHLKSTFFANISHEFRTPLTLVMGQTESLLPGEKDMERKSKLQMSLRNAKQLLHLINQLLDLSKLEAGGMQLNARSKNIIPLLKNLTASFEALANQKKIDLRFDCAHACTIVNFERDKIEKIMYNLLSNALKFTNAGGSVLVAVAKQGSTPIPSWERNRTSPLPGWDSGVGSSASNDQSPGKQLNSENCLLITVRDSGIPQDRLPHIFDRFYQVDSAKTHENEGSGIGLALTKELVELHGGAISVESAEGFGTTFTVQLPLVEATETLTGFRTLSEIEPEQENIPH